MAEKQKVQNPANRYFHIMLNMADDDLDVYEYRLLGHYIRVGKTFESTRTTAKNTKMSVGKVVSTRMSLHVKGYVRLEYGDKNDTVTVHIIDRMAENVARYNVHQMNTDDDQRSPDEQGVQDMNAGSLDGCSPDEPKKNPKDKNPKDRSKEISSLIPTIAFMMFRSSKDDTTKLTGQQYARAGAIAKTLDELDIIPSTEELNAIWDDWIFTHKKGFNVPRNAADFQAMIQVYRSKHPVQAKPAAADEQAGLISDFLKTLGSNNHDRPTS